MHVWLIWIHDYLEIVIDKEMIPVFSKDLQPNNTTQTTVHPSIFFEFTLHQQFILLII